MLRLQLNICLLCLLSFPAEGFAQDFNFQELDSIIYSKHTSSLLESQDAFTGYSKPIYDLVNSYILARIKIIDGKFSEAKKDLNQCRIESEKLELSQLNYWCSLYLSFVEFRCSEKALALSQITELQKLSDSLQIDTYLSGKLFQIKGNILASLGEEDLALDSYSKSAGIFETLKDSTALVTVVFDKANLDFKLGKYSEAGRKYKETARYFTKKGFSSKAAKSIRNWIATILKSSQLLQIHHSELDSVFNVAFSLANEGGDALTKGNLFSLNASLAGARGNDELNRIYLDSALKSFTTLGYSAGISKVYANRGNAYLKENKIDSAIHYLKESLSIANESQEFSIASYSSKKLYQIFESRNQLDKALEFLVLHTSINDTLRDKANKASLAMATTQFDLKRQENATLAARNEVLLHEKIISNQKNLLWISVIIGLALSSIAVVLWRHQRFRRISLQKELFQKERAAELERENLLQKNQFERFAALVEGEETERARISKELHDGIGGALNGISLLVESSSQDIANNREKILQHIRNTYNDVRTLSHRLFLPNQQGNSFVGMIENLVASFNQSNITFQLVVFPKSFILEMDERWQTSVYRAIQEMCTNVLKHSKASKTEIQLILHESDLQIIIEDDGVGFDRNKPTNGIGLSNLKERVENLGGSFSIDTAENRGTMIKLVLPIDTQNQKKGNS